MEEIDPRLANFLKDSVCSLWTLELLLLLHRHPRRGWTVEQADRELRATPALVIARLRQLEEIGLARCEDGKVWCFMPRTEHLAFMSDLLAQTFRERPFSVINILLTRRDDWLQRFADAFLIRPKDRG